MKDEPQANTYVSDPNLTFSHSYMCTHVTPDND